ncbi:MAG: hypothetical protein AAFZ07_28630 [Actinomycetota bacterium]
MPRVRGRNGPIGRHHELDAARGLLLANEHSRGVQLTGPGGVGKTAIARQLVAELHADDRPCAVIDRHVHPALVTTRVARALPGRAAWLRRATNDDDRVARLAASICDEPLLLVLDGLERELSPATGQFRDRGTEHLVARLVQAAEVGAGRIIVTSRCPIDELNGTLPVLPLTTLGGSELDELIGAWPRVLSLLDDLPLVIRHAVGGHPRLVELCDAVIRLGRPARQRLQRELAADVDHGATPLRDLILRVVVDRLDDRSWELLSHLAVSTMPMTTATLARALGTVRHDAVRQVAQELAALRLLLAIGPDEWALDAWTSSGIRRLESDLVTASERCLRVATARHTPDRVGVGLDDAEESVRNLLGGGHLDLAIERGRHLGELLVVDGQQLRAIGLLSELWESVPTNRPERHRIAELIQGIQVVSDERAEPVGHHAPIDGREAATAVDAPEGPPEDDDTPATAEPAPVADLRTTPPPAEPSDYQVRTQMTLSTAEPSDHQVRTQMTLSTAEPSDPDPLLRTVEALWADLDAGTGPPDGYDRLEAMLERLDELDLDPAQTRRLLRVIDASAAVTI